MLDIGIVIPELVKYGGAERFLIECVARWQEKHSITIYSTRFAEPVLREHGVSADVRLRELSTGFDGPQAMLLDGTLLPKIWQREIGRHDVYNAHLWPTHLVDVHPMVWFPHEPLRAIGDLRHNQPSGAAHVYPKHDYYSSVEGRVQEATLDVLTGFNRLGSPDRIVANSRYTAEYLSEVHGVRVRDIVYPGVSLDEFMYPFPEENMVLSVGQLWPHKRIDLVIEAMRHVEGMQLYVVGSGPQGPELKRMARAYGVTDRVFFLHDLTNHEVRTLYARSRAVVFTPVREPFGIVALEAMAAGRPLIAVPEGGFTEVVDESCALLTPPLPLAIAEKIRFVRDNPERARAMGAAGRRKAAAYTWDRTADRLLGIIERTHSSWRRRAPKRGSGPTAAPRGTLFGVQYYSWYGQGMGASHWNDNPATGGVTDAPLAGHYASALGTTAEYHLEMLEKAGVDFLVLNLHLAESGPDQGELSAIHNMFEVAESRGTAVRLALQLCPYNQAAASACALLTEISEKYAGRESYLRLGGRPVLFLFWTGVLDGRKRWISSVREAGREFLRVACSLRPYPVEKEADRTLGLFDGFCLFSPLEVTSRDRWREAWADAYGNSEAGAAGLRIVTVSPGYDDAHLTDPHREHSAHRTVPRNDGATYAEMIDFALSLKKRPQMVLMSTFNEFHENTHIEPSVAHRDLYMRMTAEMIAGFRGRRRRKRAKRRTRG